MHLTIYIYIYIYTEINMERSRKGHNNVTQHSNRKFECHEMIIQNKASLKKERLNENNTMLDYIKCQHKTGPSCSKLKVSLVNVLLKL